jgi:hypothetical protein
VKPSATGTYLQDKFLNEYYEVIRAGALAELYSQNANSWADPREAEKFETLFRVGMDEARNRSRGTRAKRMGQTQYGGL